VPCNRSACTPRGAGPEPGGLRFAKWKVVKKVTSWLPTVWTLSHQLEVSLLSAPPPTSDVICPWALCAAARRRSFEEYRFVLLLGCFGLQRDPVRGPAFSASTPFMAGFDAADFIPDASVPLLLLDQR
jgi:hypothetical protein